MSDRKNQLLEELAERVNCCYLSDLSLGKNRNLIMGALKEISAGEYPICQWNDGIYYLLRHQENFQDADQARDYLMNHIQKDG